MDEITVIIQTEIKSTESEMNVIRAVSNIFGDVRSKIDSSLNSEILKVELKGMDSLFRFKELLNLECIQNVAKKVLLKRISGKKIEFFLNKQVAFVNHISFLEGSESPLGSIRVEINYEKPKSLIDWLVSKKVK